MVQSEKRLLWHPRQENKFIVGGGNQLILYECGAEYPEIRHITSQHDLQFMKCFAWSSDPVFDDLIAIGASNGKVDLVRLSAGKQTVRKNILTSGPSVTLPARSSRACNSLAFNVVDPNYLAVGLDKVRGDASLVIWDVSSSASSLALPVSNPSEVASVVEILSQTPRPQPLLPRMESQAPKSDPRILQQHAPAEIVSAVSFLPSSTHLLLAGVSHRWLRLFDLRAPTATQRYVAAKVQGIATDPFDPHRVATFGDGVVSVWDARFMNQHLLTFTERDALADGARTKLNSMYTNVEFSSTRRGSLATLEKDSSYVRFWDIISARTHSVAEGSVFGGQGGGGSSDGETKGSRESSRGARRPWVGLGWSSGDRQPQPFPRDREGSSGDAFSQTTSVLADTRRTKYFNRSLASFALVPTRRQHPLTSNIMLVNREGDLELYAVHDTPKQVVWSARGDLAIGAGTSVRILQGIDTSPSSDDQTPDTERSRSVPNHSQSRQNTSRSRSATSRDESRIRGRPTHISGAYPNEQPQHPPFIPPTPNQPALFGRGDEDGFPALSSATPTPTPTGLSATRPPAGRMRAYSPASIHRYSAGEPGEPGPLRKRSTSRANTAAPRRQQSDSLERDRSRSRSRRRNRGQENVTKGRGIAHIIQDDVSMLMHKRALGLYGLSKAHHNMNVTTDPTVSDGSPQPLSELWSWIFHSQEIFSVPTSRIHGYDFSYQGLLGIWEGLPEYANPHIEDDDDDPPPTTQRSLLLEPTASGFGHVHTGSTSSIGSIPGGPERPSKGRSRSPGDDLRGNWPAALATLNARRGLDRSGSGGSVWKPTVSTNKLIQRQIALQLCGWSLREDEIAAAIRRWEKEDKLCRAVCWLVFMRNHTRAIELLMRSDDETHQMMSGAIAALVNLGKNNELREHYNRLVIKLNDPYLRVILIHLTGGDWIDVLEEEVIPFRERLAIAFQFLDDRALTSYLHRMKDRAASQGDLDAIIITGLTPWGMNILQSYVDRTGDVQTAAILSTYVSPHKFKDNRAERWVEAYRDLLDGFKLHHYRVNFDIERGQILNEAIQHSDGAHDGGTMGGGWEENWAPRQILIRCNYCGKPVTSHSNRGGSSAPGGPSVLMGNTASTTAPGSTNAANASQYKHKPTVCDHCGRELPRCSVCLMTLSIVQDLSREIDLGYTNHRDTFDDAIVICQTCRHGGHAVHILEWFLNDDDQRTHTVCPVADCNCRCADEF